MSGMTKEQKRKLNLSMAQTLLSIHLRECGVQRIEYEYRFHPERLWRADIFLPDEHILVECDGGVYAGSKGHKRGDALADDYMKQNYAAMLGYRLLRFTNSQVLTGEALYFMREWFLHERNEQEATRESSQAVHQRR